MEDTPNEPWLNSDQDQLKETPNKKPTFCPPASPHKLGRR